MNWDNEDLFGRFFTCYLQHRSEIVARSWNNRGLQTDIHALLTMLGIEVIDNISGTATPQDYEDFIRQHNQQGVMFYATIRGVQYQSLFIVLHNRIEEINAPSRGQPLTTAPVTENQMISFLLWTRLANGEIPPDIIVVSYRPIRKRLIHNYIRDRN